MGRSVGAAAAQGIESGFGLGLRMRDQQLQEQDVERRNRLQDEDRTYLRDERTRKRQTDDEDAAFKALDAQYDALRSEGEGYTQQYGKDVPAEIAGPYSQRVSEVTSTRNSMLRKRYEPIVKKREQELADLSSRLQAGQIDIKDVPDGDLYRAVVTAGRRDPNDLLGIDGKPSRVAQSVTDVMTGLETKNEGMLLRGANVLLAPELKVGIGETSPHGGRIVGKEIVKMIPDPNDPGKFMPVVKVYVSKGKAQSSGDVARGERTREDGGPAEATGYYLAPITDNRSGDPEDTVKSIDLKRAMEYAGQMQTLSTMLDRPDLRAKIERGAAEAAKQPDNFLQAFYAVKGKMPAKQVDFKTVKPGERLVGLDPQGRQVNVIEGPPKSATATGLAGQISAVQQYAEENGVDFDEAATQLQRRGLLRAPGKGGAGGAGGGGLGGAPSGRSSTLSGEEFLKSLPADDARIVKGLADGTIKPSEISTKGNRRESMLAKAKQYQADADMGSKAGKLDSPKDKFEAENKLRDEYQKSSGTFTKMRDAYGLVQAAAKDPSAAGDMSLIFAFMRVLDPNSVVREGEFATAQNAAGVPDRVVNTYNRILKGERLNPDQRADFVNQAKKIFESQKTGQDKLDSNYDRLAKSYGLNRENIITSFDTSQAAPSGTAPGAAPVRTATNPKTGQKLMLKDGQWVPMQ